MIIREMKKTDILPSSEILVKVFNNDTWKECWDINRATLYLEDFYNANKFIGYVIEENDKVVASVFAKRKVWWSGDEIFIEELFVNPDIQNKGYGSILIKKIEEYALNNNCFGITLATNRFSYAPNFYLKHGFIYNDMLSFMNKNLK